MLQDSMEATEIANKMIQNINELRPPIPFNISQFEGDEDDDEIIKQNAKQQPAEEALITDEEQDLIHVPTREYIEGEEVNNVIAYLCVLCLWKILNKGRNKTGKAQ